MKKVKMKNSFAVIILFTVVFFVLFAGTAKAHPAWAIAVDDKNQIYLSDLEKIWKIDASGKVSIFSERHTHEMTFDKDGNLIGEELQYDPATGRYTSAIWKITPNNQFSYILPPTETPPKGISIWKNRNGATFYFGQTETEPREFFLLKRSANGAVKVLFGNKEKALRERQIVPYSFAGMTFARDDSLYFKNGATIWKAASDETISIVADELNFAATAPNVSLFGLTADDEKNIYTAEYNSGKILKITPDRKLSVVSQTETNWKPTGVYFKNKNLYVLEFQNISGDSRSSARVRKISADGGSTVIAAIGSERNAGARANETSIVSPNASPTFPNQSKVCFSLGLIVAFAATGFVILPAKLK